jgi:hypothetical protein
MSFALRLVLFYALLACLLCASKSQTARFAQASDNLLASLGIRTQT